MSAPSVTASSPTPPAEVWAPLLSNWKIQDQAAKWHDRNLLQYGGAFAALLGIGGGSGGLLALAHAVTPDKQAPLLPDAFVLGIAAFVLALAAGLAVLMCREWRQRVKAENDAKTALQELIEANPTPFLPNLH